MSETIFVCYASEDAPARAALARPLKALPGTNTFIDVNIAAGTNWRAQIDDALDRASVCIILVSNDLLISEFVRGIEFPALFGRWQSGTLALFAVHLTDSVWEASAPDLGQAQWPLRGRPPIRQMAHADAENAWSDVARATRRAATAAPLVRRWLASKLTASQIRAHWTMRVPGVPEPWTGRTTVDVAWTLAMDLVERGCHELEVAPAQPLEKPVVRVWIKPISGRRDSWTIEAWVREHGEVKSLPIADSEVTTEELPAVLDRVFICHAPTGIARLEFVTDTLTCDNNYGTWQVNDELGPTPVCAPVVLREAFRVRHPQYWDVLSQRAKISWTAACIPGIGAGGGGCKAAAQLLDPSVVGDAARLRLEGAAAVGAGLLSLPTEGDERRARLTAIIRFGLPVAVWSTDDDAVRDLLTTVPVAELREALYKREGTNRRTHLIFDDPADPIAPDTYRPPS